MDSFKIYTQLDVFALTNQREGEEKLGERVQIYRHCESLSRDFGKRNDEAISLLSLQQSSAKFVLLGIPEDIGVRANLGIGGAKTAWQAAIKALLNTQSNSFLTGEEILVLGHFEIEEPTDQSLTGLRNKVSEIDTLVKPLIEKIVRAGKIPIVIGGGHNNAAPIIAGVSQALNQAINVINIDAHTDLRATKEGRHSGNGFSFAIENGFLNRYHIFGLHQNYVNKEIAAQIDLSQNIKVVYFEELLQSEASIVAHWNNFTENLTEPRGLEIDLDSIENVLSSAITPSGFALNDIRKILLSNRKPYRYLHLCEGTTELADGRTDGTTGKTIAYLVSDFVKAHPPHIFRQL